MKSKIAQQVLGLAEYYDKTLSENQLSMFVEDLSELDFDQLQFAIRKYRQDPLNVFFPLPAKLIAIITPVLNEKDEAQEVANLIITAVSKYGYTNPEQARKFMGDLAWETVIKMSGWKHICETLTIENEGMIRAQIRGMAEVVSKKAKRGELDQTPQLPQSSEVRKLIGSVFKEMEKA